jgi:hypothetical protein
MAKASPVQVPGCVGCGSVLIGPSESRGPECGQQFDNQDSRTHSDKRGPLRLPRAWLRPPGLWHCGLCLVLLAFFLEIRSTVGNPFYLRIGLVGTLLLNMALVLLAAYLLTDYIVRAVAGRRLRTLIEPVSGSGRCKRNTLRWAVAPVCLALVGSSFPANWPLTLRFSLSQKACEEAAVDYIEGSRTDTGSQWIGLIYCHKVYIGRWQGGSMVLFRTGGKLELMESARGYVPVGMVFRPDDPWPAKSNRIAARWYIEVD